MTVLIVADSVYGNTRRVAEAIAESLDGARLVDPFSANASDRIITAEDEAIPLQK